MDLYSDFRSALEIKEIDDKNAKELFIALEECFKYGESGIDFLLKRISIEGVRKHIVSNGVSPEYKKESDFNSRKYMEDGINKIKLKRLEKRNVEIEAELRNNERAGNSENIDELIAEKMSVDSQIRKLEGK